MQSRFFLYRVFLEKDLSLVVNCLKLYEKRRLNFFIKAQEQHSSFTAAMTPKGVLAFIPTATGTVNHGASGRG